ncbi:secretin N-terminal domain-containing protein [Candidatus Omnitrophota bacterium]
MKITKKTSRIFFLLLCAVIIIFTLSARTVMCGEEDLKMKVFSIDHGSVEDAAKVAEELKSPEGKVTAHSSTRKLIVVDYPENLSRLEEVLKSIDVPQRQVTIKLTVSEISTALTGRIGLNRGLALLTPEEFGEVTLAIDSEWDSETTTEMTLTTMSGHPASISVSQEEIFGGLVIMHPEGIAIMPPVVRSAGNFLEVLPVAHNDDTVTVTIRPEVSEFRDEGTIHSRSILTEMRVPSGYTMALGGTDSAYKSRTKQFAPVYTQASYGTKKIVMFLTVNLGD